MCLPEWLKLSPLHTLEEAITRGTFIVEENPFRKEVSAYPTVSRRLHIAHDMSSLYGTH